MPFCSNCGNEINDNAKFCPKCGTAANAENEPASTTQNNTSGYKLSEMRFDNTIR